MTINTELLQETLEHIETHPDKWDQRLWLSDCGTVGCFAGWAVLLSSAQVSGSNGWYCVKMPDGERMNVAAAAEYLLGLTSDQARELFHELNDLDHLRTIVKTLVDTGLTPNELAARELERAESL